MARPGGNGRTGPDGAPASPRRSAAPLLPSMPFLKPGQRPLPAGFRLPLAYTLHTCFSKPPSSQQSSIPQSADGMSLSFLEQIAVKPATSKDYRLRVSNFCKWCLARGITWRSVEEQDAVLTMCFDEMFFKGELADHGSKLLRSSSQALREPRLPPRGIRPPAGKPCPEQLDESCAQLPTLPLPVDRAVCCDRLLRGARTPSQCTTPPSRLLQLPAARCVGRAASEAVT